MMNQKYIALLRGINVGGHIVKMEQLRTLFAELGLANVRSFINSGNIFFEADKPDRVKLTTTIEQHLKKVLGYEVPVFLRTLSELESIISQEPFKGIELTSDRRFCVVFTKTHSDRGIVLPQYSSKKDIDLVALNPYEAFVVWHIINGRPPSGKFPEDVLPPINTTRFYHSLAKILNAAKAD